MCLRVTRHARGHTTWQASSYTNTLSCPCSYGHCNHRMRLAARSLHSHKSGVTPAVTRLVTRQSRGHPRPLRSFALIGIFSFYSAFRVASTQRHILLYLVHFTNRLHSHVTWTSPEGHPEVTQSQYYHKQASYSRRLSHFIKIQRSFFAADHIACLSFI